MDEDIKAAALKKGANRAGRNRFSYLFEHVGELSPQEILMRELHEGIYEEYSQEDCDIEYNNAFSTEISSYSFVCDFRDSNLCPYYYEVQAILYKDARLVVSSVGPKPEHKNYEYNLSDMDIGLETRNDMGIIALTDTIVFKVKEKYKQTLKILKAVIKRNEISLKTPIMCKETFPYNYQVMDLAQYKSALDWENILKNRKEKEIIERIYSYDAYLKKLLVKCVDLNIFQDIYTQKLYTQTDWLATSFRREDAPGLAMCAELLAKETGCTDVVADETIMLLCNMIMS